MVALCYGGPSLWRTRINNVNNVMLYSNPAVQIAAIEAGALQQLIRLLSIETSVAFRSRLLAALSSLIRHFPFAQRKFLELGGLQTVTNLLNHQSYGSEKLSVKAVALISDLLAERVCNSAVFEDPTNLHLASSEQ